MEEVFIANIKGQNYISLMNISFETQAPLAETSPDHIFPYGTARDNYVNPYFNAKIFRLYSYLGRFPRVLDLGCAGGGFVRTCIDQGALAVGVEGSDYSLRMSRSEWPNLGNRFLFTGDISEPFRVLMGKEILKFEVITLWEVIEHIEEKKLETLLKNLEKHLSPEGIVIMSVAPIPESLDGHELHQTVQPRKWWIDLVKSHGFHPILQYEKYFNSQYIRGFKQCARDSFHLILSKDPSRSPKIPKLALKEKLIDSWVGSRLQKKIQKIICPTVDFHMPYEYGIKDKKD